MITEEQILEALGRVDDPCSVATGSPLSLVEMGLYEGYEISDEGDLVVRLCVTSPSCSMVGQFGPAAERELAALPGVRSARIEIDTRVFWLESRMSGRGAAQMQERREEAIARLGIVPWAERHAAELAAQGASRTG